MNKDTKILCVCRSGTFRSVETKRVLNLKGYNDVVAIGGLKISPDTLNMLCKWADIILLAKQAHGGNIKDKYRSKINTEFNIGSDMNGIVRKQLNKIGL